MRSKRIVTSGKVCKPDSMLVTAAVFSAGCIIVTFVFFLFWCTFLLWLVNAKVWELRKSFLFCFFLCKKIIVLDFVGAKVILGFSGKFDWWVVMVASSRFFSICQSFRFFLLLDLSRTEEKGVFTIDNLTTEFFLATIQKLLLTTPFPEYIIFNNP